MPKIAEELRDGLKIGRFTLGPLVLDVINHPLFPYTNGSYVKQGRLRECYCVCGEVKLVSEAALRTGRVTSCGCRRQEILMAGMEKSRKERQSRKDRELAVKTLKEKIKTLRKEIVRLQMIDPRIRDFPLIERKVLEVRSLTGQLGNVVREQREAKDARRWTQAQCEAQSARMKEVWARKLSL